MEPDDGEEMTPAPEMTETLGSDTAVETNPPPSGNKSTARLVFEWVAILAVSLLVALVVRNSVVQTYYIPSGSMEPTLQIGDRIFVDKLAYDFRSPHRFDIVVFKRPASEDCPGPPVADLVKRVIGLPGDKIASSGSNVYIDGKLLKEPFLPEGANGGPEIAPVSDPLVVPKDQYFMMGDNRDNSCDSRDWGTLPSRDIVGEVVFRIWPLNRIGFP